MGQLIGWVVVYLLTGRCEMRNEALLHSLAHIMLPLVLCQ